MNTALRNHKISVRNTYNALTEDLQYLVGELRAKVYNIDNMKDELPQLKELRAHLDEMIALTEGN